MKSVALTFDDGPHPKYTEQVTAIIEKYGLRAAFFQLGVNVGTLDSANAVKLSKNVDIVRRLMDAGHTVANHSYLHRRCRS
jgi:peptidoglycan/xylan/chitin deacetylase (PgdA/CDA1 family)